MWWALANTARVSIKRWDATFASTLREALSDAGLTNQDVLFSVNEVRKDHGGEWIEHHITVRLSKTENEVQIRRALERAGARLEQVSDAQGTTLIVRRGNRIYQTVHFVRP